ncbi:small, acid-soluble spore protein K [Salirhabdus salicampi]|uniref:small, acid-soluble spore protein K n=1 Tax=Salirhabdus salicampi TaxID=476102 RepID=UPI0020C218A7|nr:small, acid-soluble spore protein K [Salirhabdus salicampi]MCP8617963.1 small, acid-soluble spore protein K [Salirhabdus salicampi]
MVRNKAKNFPEKHFQEIPHAKARFASKRADGSINTRPQERMAKSSRPHINGAE